MVAAKRAASSTVPPTFSGEQATLRDGTQIMVDGSDGKHWCTRTDPKKVQGQAEHDASVVAAAAKKKPKPNAAAAAGAPADAEGGADEGEGDDDTEMSADDAETGANDVAGETPAVIVYYLSTIRILFTRYLFFTY